jgi:endonuclease YncB( thermonuclease family)
LSGAVNVQFGAFSYQISYKLRPLEVNVSMPLGAIMVREGLAWAFVRKDYVGQEGRAKADRLGVHVHDCTAAWEWRAQQKR